MYNVTLNIVGLHDQLVKTLIDIGKLNDFDVVEDKGYTLSFKSDCRAKKFTQLIMQLSAICDCYGVDYVSLL